MPLKPAQLLAALQAKQADFQTFDHTILGLLQQYRQALAQISQQSSEGILERTAHKPNPGAAPLEPLGTYDHWVVPSNLHWISREQSLSWVRDRLTGIATFAVDGSQIYPSKDLSIPIALVQIGWYENLHQPGGAYRKDIELDIMTPTDLQVSHSGELAERQVNMRRFQMETERLIAYMQEQTDCQNCLALFDGALVVAFAEVFEPEARDFYVQCILKLLRASEEYQVPLVGYIDTTYARDLIGLLQCWAKLPLSPTLHDAQLLARKMSWGDRTPIFQCQRAGILGYYQEHCDRLAFTYLKTHEGYPARLEFPLWLYQSDRWPQVLDWLRAEVVIGGGYPYVLEAADETAVLQAADRQLFYQVFQNWTETVDIKLRLSRKMVSKVRRR